MYSASLEPRSLPAKQRGAALILALVVVTIVVLLASSLTSDFMVTYKRVENQLLGQQSYAYMRGAEGIARKILIEDYQANTGKDHRSEGWLNNTVEFPMDQGAIAGTVCDLQARFNVNNLSNRTGQYSADQKLFIRLLQSLPLEDPLDQQAAEDITNAVTDWIDEDDVISSTGGAEDGYYSSIDPPMKTANQIMHSISELRWVKGMTAEILHELAPFIMALPVKTPLNINTAPLVLLRAINEKAALEPLTESQASNLLVDRDGDIEGDFLQQKGGFDQVEEFVAAHPSVALETDNLSVSSDYFLLNTQTYFKDRQFQLSTVFFRDSGGLIKTLARGKSGFGRCKSNKQ